jgi:outer membrane protein assembly factor BamB
MGHIQPDTDQVVQSFQAASHIYGGPVVWASGGATRLYLWGVSDFLKGFQLTSGSFNTTPFATGTVMPAPLEAHGNPCGIISLSSNGNVAGSAIVWANVPTANPSLTTVPGVLYAFDALTLKTLWSSAQNPTRDGFGNYAKFVAPTIVNGKVYLATHSKKIVVYGLLPG